MAIFDKLPNLYVYIDFNLVAGYKKWAVESKRQFVSNDNLF